MPESRVLLIVLDGLGYSRSRLSELKEETWKNLPDNVSSILQTQVESVLSHDSETFDGDPSQLAMDVLLPVAVENLSENTLFDEANSRLRTLEALLSASAGTDVLEQITNVVREQATHMRYVPVAARAGRLAEIRNSHLTIPTSASGKWAGFEEADPPIQGNSDTGHQQIANLRLAPQLALEITRSIEDGSFFTNTELTGVISKAVADQRAINFTYLLSGVGGEDGRVHSAWNHLEAFLHLLFEIHQAEPRLVHMQAVLDGRDSPDTSSLTKVEESGGYIDRLETLLSQYDAKRSLAWVIGRNQAMDRDYREPNVRADYESMVSGAVDTVRGFGGLKKAISEFHKDGIGDADIPALGVISRGTDVQRISHGDAFVNLNFRADRQRAKVAALAGGRNFLSDQSGSRGRDWNLDWMKPDLNLDICGIADYHPDLGTRYGVKTAYPNRPHPDNLLSLFQNFAPQDQYLLIGESIKELHMGYFLRGRKELSSDSNHEVRNIIPSFGEHEGVMSDSDVYKVPGMRSPEIARELIQAMSGRRFPLICANFANTDMLGHLLPRHFDAAVSAYEAVDLAVGKVVKMARDFGYHVIITSDHGNVEEDTSSHSNNDVLTTVVAPAGRLKVARREVFQAKLFDVPWTIGRILGVEDELKRHIASSGDANVGGWDVGRPILEPM